MIINALKIILLGLLSIGLYSALSVSYATVTGISPCPNIAMGIPACFIVLIGYTLMLIATLKGQPGKNKWIFFSGWSSVFLLAFFASIFEILNGNTCPTSNTGLALCYVSLALAVGIIALYFLIEKTESNQ